MKKIQLLQMVILIVACAPVMISARSPLTYDERVNAQEAIERVYYRHRVWPKENGAAKPAFEQVVPKTVIDGKVKDYLKKSYALNEYWKRPLTGAQLQAEVERIVRSTKDPETLAELFSALGNEPDAIAECLARPILADRLVRRLYAFDREIHGAQRQKVLEIQKILTRENFATWPEGQYQEVRLNATPEGGLARPLADPGLLGMTENRLAESLSWSTSKCDTVEFEECADAFVLKLCSKRDTKSWEGAARVFPKRPFEEWLDSAVPVLRDLKWLDVTGASYSLPPLASATGDFKPETWLKESFLTARSWHAAVWTGDLMLVWGGFNYLEQKYLDSGMRYDPASDSWSQMSSLGAPSARTHQQAVWTGTEMLVWGGYCGSFLQSGGRYNPTSDTWSTISTGANCPVGCTYHTAVWSGSEMLVWGGYSALDGDYSGTGGRYNPGSDTWTAISTGTNCPGQRIQHTAVYADGEMIIWGGHGCPDPPECSYYDYLNTGGRYNLASDTWTATSTGVNCPSARTQHTVVWSGTYMIVWGGDGWSNNGGRYAPSSNTWLPVSATSAPAGREKHTAVWTGSRMIIWGGESNVSPYYLSNGGLYDPSGDSWTSTSNTGAPSGRFRHSAVWASGEMIVWGGANNQTSFDTGGRFDPTANSWAQTSIPYATYMQGRDSFSTVWTGTEVVAWGGNDNGVTTNSGSSYNPTLDSFSTTPAGGLCPGARRGHTAVWSGEEMIIWGGLHEPDQAWNDGARFNPVTGIWAAVSTAGAPVARKNHTAVWTGGCMVVWGGENGAGSTRYNSGGRYYPGTDGWTATDISDPDIPPPRCLHTAVWTGSEMVVWGGAGQAAFSYFSDGGRYTFDSGNPSDPGSWTRVTDAGAPYGRAEHTAVWTGSEMIVWGGADSWGTWNDGGRYNVSSNSWTSLPLNGTPSERRHHSALWTGYEMVVWGGASGTPPNEQITRTGGRYVPSLNIWKTTPLTGAPEARRLHGAAWTGRGMIVLGGNPSSSMGYFFTNTPPVSNPEILNAAGGQPGVLKLGMGEPLRLTQTIAGAHPAGWFDDVEGDLLWLPSSGWHVLTSEDCTGVGDAYSPYRSWRFGTLGACDYDRAAGTYNLTSAGSFIAEEGLNLSFRYFLNTDRLKGDSASAQLCKCTSPTDCSNCSSEANWGTVATDKSHWSASLPPETVLMEDNCEGWRAVEMGLPASFSAGSAFMARFSFSMDSNDNSGYGWYIDDIGIGLAPGDGSNTCVTSADSRGNNPGGGTPYHDAFDRAYFEWDLNADGAPDNPDRNTPAFEVPEGNLGLYGLDIPGDHTLSLKVVDSSGLSKSSGVTLHVVDGQVPSVKVMQPDGGDSWPYSPDSADRQERYILWDSSDNFRVSQTRLSYSTDGGSRWTCIADSGTNYQKKETIIIPDNAGAATSAIEMTAAGNVSHVNVTVNILHQRVEDLTLTLIGPDSTAVILVSEGGASGANFTGTTFDDGATRLPSSGVAPFSGVFKPAGQLLNFIGKPIAGAWTLRVEDGADGIEGSIASWSISFVTGSGCTNQCTGGSDILLPDSVRFLWALPTAAEAQAANQVFPSAECKVMVETWDDSGNRGVDVSDGPFYIIQPTATAIQTLIVTSRSRLAASYGATAAEQVWDKLLALAMSSKVNGAVLDLDNVAGLASLYDTWDNTPLDSPANKDANIAAANTVAEAIRAYLISQVSSTYTNAAYLVLVGDDGIIPSYRVHDGTTFYSETEYLSNVDTGTPVGAAIEREHYLSDGVFGDMVYNATGVGAGFIALPDLSTGRLVETPEEMIRTVDTFLAMDGEIDLGANGALVTGYDFLLDSATNIRQMYTREGKPVHHHIDNGWSPSDLEGDLFPADPDNRFALCNLNDHSTHFSFGTPNGPLSTASMDAHAGDPLKGSLFYNVGCHSGLNVPPSFAEPLDLPQLMMGKGAVAYIGNTGFGWGFKHGVGYSERLMEILTDQILSRQSCALGDALFEAKKEYFVQNYRYDVFDEKVLFQSTLYGLPMYKVVLGSSLVRPSNDLLKADGPDYQVIDGISVKKSLDSGGEASALPPGVTELTLNFEFGPETYFKWSTTDGDYYTLNGRSSDEIGDTLQPMFIYDSKLSDTVCRGVVFTGGDFVAESGFTPVVGVPMSNNTDNGAGPIAPGMGGMIGTIGVHSPNLPNSGPNSSKTRMNVYTGYYTSSTERHFDQIGFVVYYSNSGDSTKPEITDPGAAGFHTMSGLTANFSVEVLDASGVYRVLVAYTDGLDQWNSLDLAYNGSSGMWEGQLAVRRNLTYFVQAVDNAGNAGILALTGQDLDSNGQPYGSSYSNSQIFSITLQDSDSDGMPDPWEIPNGLNPTANDAAGDPDGDLLLNLEEYWADSDPQTSDSDHDGDNDGSEAHNGRSPINPSDGMAITITLTGDSGNVVLEWPAGAGFNSAIDGPYWIYRSEDPTFEPGEELGTVPQPLPDSAVSYSDPGALSGPTYYYTVTNVRYLGPAPSVNSVSPTSGPAAGGTTLKIFGENFQTGCTVKVGWIPATSVVVSNPSMITCRTPAGTVGIQDVTVTNPDGQRSTLRGGFAYY